MKLTKLLAATGLAGALVLASITGAAAQQPPPTGPKPVPNAAGAFGPTWLAARIASNGTHVAGTGGLGLTSSSKLTGSGQYEVLFRRVITRCIPMVTIARQGAGSEAAGFAEVVQRGGNNKGFFVQTYDATGTRVDRNFTLLVYCTT